MILILTGPSCCGKTTQAKILIEKHNFKQSVSYTTREIRPTEINNIDYNFIDINDFENKINNNFFLEYTKNFGNYYGTSLKDISNLSAKYNVVMSLCLKGFQAAQKYLKGTIGIYLLPPTKEELLKRLNDRQSTKEEIEKRTNDIIKTSKIESKYFSNKIESNSIDITTNKILEILKIYNF